MARTVREYLTADGKSFFVALPVDEDEAAFFGDGFQYCFDRLFVGTKIRSKPTFIAHACGITLLLQH